MAALNFLTLTSDTQFPAHLHPNHESDPFSTHEPEVHLYMHEYVEPQPKVCRTRARASTVNTVASSGSAHSTDESSSDGTEQYPPVKRDVSADSVETPQQQVESPVPTHGRSKAKDRRAPGSGEKKNRFSKGLTKRLSLWWGD